MVPDGPEMAPSALAMRAARLSSRGSAATEGSLDLAPCCLAALAAQGDARLRLDSRMRCPVPGLPPPSRRRCASPLAGSLPDRPIAYFRARRGEESLEVAPDPIPTAEPPLEVAPVRAGAPSARGRARGRRVAAQEHRARRAAHAYSVAPGSPLRGSRRALGRPPPPSRLRRSLIPRSPTRPIAQSPNRLLPSPAGARNPLKWHPAAPSMVPRGVPISILLAGGRWRRRRGGSRRAARRGRGCGARARPAAPRWAPVPRRGCPRAGR